MIRRELIGDGLAFQDIAEATFECTRPIPLGAENGVLPDAAFTATSFTTSREPHRARLHGQFGKNGSEVERGTH